ncbi:MAG: orotate phosphoribosyltransferase [Bauldia sp.]
MLSAEERARLIAIISERSFRRGSFKLASGRESSLYFNLKPTLMQPEGSYLAARALYALSADTGADYAGGLEMGAVPILGAIAAISHMAGRPLATFFVRKAAKDHGTKSLVEGLKDGETLAGKRVLMIDDVTTTGGSTAKAIEAARTEGAVVDFAVSLLDREEGATENMAKIGVTLRSVLRASDFV